MCFVVVIIQIIQIFYRILQIKITPLDNEDMVTFFKDKETEKTIKDYEYLLNEKQSTLDNYVQYLDTVCELTKIESQGY
jgi:hypothetical protein